MGIAADTRAGLELCWEPWCGGASDASGAAIALPWPETDVGRAGEPLAGQTAVDVATTPSARPGRGGVAMENDTMTLVTLKEFLEQAQAAAQAHTRGQTEMWKTLVKRDATNSDVSSKTPYWEKSALTSPERGACRQGLCRSHRKSLCQPVASYRTVHQRRRRDRPQQVATSS